MTAAFPRAAHKALLKPLRKAMADFEERTVLGALDRALAPDATVRLFHPLGTISGPGAFYDAAYRPLFDAWPDLERRDTIVIAGVANDSEDWVGCGGYYTGTFVGPLFGIPPTGQQAAMRFHEFYRIRDGAVVEIQAIWDLPEVMLQANAWPMAPSLGREWHVPGPATQDGLIEGDVDESESQRSLTIVVDMLNGLKRHPREPAPAMEMPRYWHPRMNWYGPAGIGSCRGIRGFRHIHQIPFLNAMPDRGQYFDEIVYHFFAERAYVAVTGWPNMMQTLSDAGWLGLPPMGRRITMRSLDFWRIEDGLIRENWVLVDLLHMYDQLGIDVFARLAEMTKTRSMARVPLPQDDAE